MATRRAFLGAISLPTAYCMAGLPPPRRRRAPSGLLAEIGAPHTSPDDAARDEDYWALVARAFTVDRSIINLNNGGVSPAPGPVQDAMKRRLDYANSCPPPVALWREQQPQREHVRERLARHWGVDAEEVAITRNSSESLQICQFGHELHAGDEVLATTVDYPRMITTFRQRERREGLVLKQFRLPIPAEDDDEIVRLYEANITPSTRLILMSHIVNITGQIMPVRRVVEMARTKNGGIPVIVDGAHALAHFAFKIPDLGCDYYGVSLHKWLFAPHGTGLLYVRREKVKGLWALMASGPDLDDNIRKFEEIGTHPEAPSLSIAEALTFHQAIGDARKEARLRYLRDYWAKRLLETGRARLHTSLRPAFSCGIATVQVEGVDSAGLCDWLWEGRNILTTAITHPEFEGLRITPSVYTSLEELDRFCDRVEWSMKKGLSAH
ncbi:MAG: aminotransferase class V-fold PLP-dependent enzyme [Phycisphaerales bacterium]|nr:aminotransferase class V-fold PLP-dependent enzyme [Phycisphaerales bacterium]